MGRCLSFDLRIIKASEDVKAGILDALKRHSLKVSTKTINKKTVFSVKETCEMEWWFDAVDLVTEIAKKHKEAVFYICGKLCIDEDDQIYIDFRVDYDGKGLISGWVTEDYRVVEDPDEEISDFRCVDKFDSIEEAFMELGWPLYATRYDERPKRPYLTNKLSIMEIFKREV